MSYTPSIQEKGLHIGSQPGEPDKLEGISEDFEVFKQTEDGVNFRTVGWPMATVIFLKTIFALGVLSIPAAMYTLGAVGGSLSVIGWQALNTYTAVLQGDFRNNHPRCHSIADMAGVVGGIWMKELTGALFIVAYVILTGSGIVGVSIGINALSHHGACTVWWAVLATFFVALAASARKFHQIGWLTWIGFASIFIAVFIIVVAVTTRDRPAAAPPTGPYEFGFYAIAYPSFAAGMVASCTIFVSGAGTSAMLPVISEMKNPRDYRKALFICMGIVTAAYLSFSLVVYRWCGKWVASPSLGVSLLHPRSCAQSLIVVTECWSNHQDGLLRYRSTQFGRQCLSLPPRRRKIHLRPCPSRLATPSIQHHDPLGHLALLHFRSRNYLFRSRRSHPYLRVPAIPCRQYLFCPSGHRTSRLAVDL